MGSHHDTNTSPHTVPPIGDALRMYRVKCRLTQSELVALLKENANISVDQAYLSRVETNLVRPRQERLAAICAQLNCSISDIYDLAQKLCALGQRRDEINRLSSSLVLRDAPAAGENVSNYQTATLAARVGLWRFDLETGQLWLSASALDLLDSSGHSSDWKEYVVPTDRRYIRRAVFEALRRGYGDFECHVKLQSSRGQRWDVQMTGTIERGQMKRALSLVGAFVPVPEHHRIAMHALDAIRGVFIFAKNRNLEFTFANRALVEAFGKKSAAEILGRTDSDLHPYADEVRFFNEMDQKAIDLFDRSASAGLPRSGDAHRLAINEEFLTDAQGKRHVLATVKEPIVMPNNEVQIFGVATDVTEFYELKSSFDHLLHCVGDTGDVIYFKDVDSRFTRANRAMAKLAGVDAPEQLIGRCDHDFFPPEFADQWLQEERQIFASGIPSVNKICRNQMPDGTIVWRMVSKYPVCDDSGRVRELIGIGKDITDLIVARDRVRFESQLFDKVVNADSVKMCIWVKDLTGRYIKSNELFAKRHGYSMASQIIGKTDYNHWPKEVADAYRVDDNRVVQSRTAKVCYTERQRWRDGRESLIVTSKFPILDGEGEVVAVLGMYYVICDTCDTQRDEFDAIRQAKVRMARQVKKISHALSDCGLSMSGGTI